MTTDNPTAAREPQAQAVKLTMTDLAALKAFANSEEVPYGMQERLIDKGVLEAVDSAHNRITDAGRALLAEAAPAEGGAREVDALQVTWDENEAIDKCLYLLGLDPADSATSVFGIHAAIKSNLEIGTPKMSKIEDWTDTALNKGSITEKLFAQQAQIIRLSEANADLQRQLDLMSDDLADCEGSK